MIPAKLAYSVYRFFPHSSVRVADHDRWAANESSRSLQLLHHAAAERLALAVCGVANHIAREQRQFRRADHRE